MSAEAPQSNNKVWLAATKVIFSLGLLYFLFSQIEVEELADTLSRMEIWAVIVVIAIFGLQSCLQGLRWWLVLGGLSVPLDLGRAIRLTFVGVFFNQVMPTSVGGDAMRIWYLYQSKIGVDMAIKSVLLERVMGVLGMCTLVAIGVAFLGETIQPSSLRYFLMAVLPICLVGVVVLLSLDFMPFRLRQWRPLAELAQLANDARRIFFEPRIAIPAVILSLTVHSLSSLAVYVFAMGLNLDVTLWQCLAIVPMVLLSLLIPISFAGWGLRESAMVYLLGLLGVTSDAALAVSLIFGIAMIAAALPGCAFWLTWRKTSTVEQET